MKPKHDSIRGWFAAALHDEMEKDERIWLLTGDLGWGMLDDIRDDFPERFLNCGASEQLALGIGVGLALEGFRPFIYSITTFLVYRPLEWIRNYLWYENIPVRLIGSGMDADYAHDGITHQPYEIERVLNLFQGIDTYFPNKKEVVQEQLQSMITTDKPSFMCLRR